VKLIFLIFWESSAHLQIHHHSVSNHNQPGFFFKLIYASLYISHVQLLILPLSLK